MDISGDGQRGWKRTLFVVWLAEVSSFAGFSFAFPFLPFYVRQELGVTDPSHVSIWVGVIQSSAAVTMGLMAPIWGMIADKYGRKLMVERSMLGACASLLLMSLAQSPWHLLAIRIVQGALSGTISAATAMVASATPSKRTGFSLGFLQTATFIGTSVGPLVGGIAAEWAGYRLCFIAGGVMVGMGAMLVILFATEERSALAPAGEGGGSGGAPGLKAVLATAGFLALLGVLTVTHMTRQSFAPIFPLYVEDILDAGSKVRAPSMTGLLLGLGGAAAALSAMGMGWLSDRWRPGRILTAATLAGGSLFMSHVLLWSVIPLAFVRAGVGATMGAIQPSLNTLVHRMIPRQSHGRAYGLTQSAMSLGMVLGPSIGGLLGAAMGFRLPFLIIGACEFLTGVFLLLFLQRLLGAGNGGRAAGSRPAAPDGVTP